MYSKIFFISLMVSACVAESFLPNFMRVCNVSDPNLNECVKESMESLRPHLVKGIPELQIPPCEPLYINNLSLAQGSGPLAAQVSMQNIQLWNISNFNLSDVKIDLQNHIEHMRMNFPMLSMMSDYKIKGQIMMMPIEGSGVFSGNFTDITTNTTMHLEHVEVNGTKYLYCKNVSVDFDMGDAKIKLDNVYGGKDKMGFIINELLKENWKLILDDMKPMIRDIMNNMIRAYANGFFKNFPIDLLFPN